ncbi:hypothetical protein MRO13_18300 (plasmid) [Vibrio metschnikovii]
MTAPQPSHRARVSAKLLKMAIEAGEQRGQCSLSLHDIAAKLKQKYNV